MTTAKKSDSMGLWVLPECCLNETFPASYCLWPKVVHLARRSPEHIGVTQIAMAFFGCEFLRMFETSDGIKKCGIIHVKLSSEPSQRSKHPHVDYEEFFLCLQILVDTNHQT